MQRVSLSRTNRQLHHAVAVKSARISLGKPFARATFIMPLRHSNSAGTIDLQCPAEALGMVGVNACRRQRIHYCQFFMDSDPPVQCGLGGYLRANRRFRARHLIQPLQKSLKIEHGTAHQQRRLTPSDDIDR